eukprot:m.13025 g.13025  ORF g.13025 m.13025 type:complete len:874 (+) comp24450_c0_seq1:273-2894(+)
MLRIALWIAFAQTIGALQFTREPRDGTVKKGKTVSLVCQATGSPKPGIQWLFNDRHLTEFDGQNKLKVTNVAPSNAGEYRCLATNAEGTIVSRKAVIRYHGLPDRFEVDPADAVHYIEPLTNKSSHGTVVFHCVVASLLFSPNPVIHWERKINARTRKVSQTTTKRYFSYQYGRTSTLQIQNPTKSDFLSSFRCVATNSRVSSTIVESTRAQIIRSSDAIYKGPLFKEKPSGLNIPEGGSAVFGCAFQGSVRNFKWSRLSEAGSQFVANATHSEDDRKSVSGAHNLAISSVRLSDAGKYVCSAETTLGSTLSASALLKIIAKPTFDQKLSPVITVVAGRPLTLTCKAKGVRMFWLNDGDVVETSGSRTQLANGSLYFSNVAKHDRGVYQCYIENELGDGAQSATKLIVEYPATVTVRPQKISIIEGDNVTLPCEAEGNPSEIAYRWQKNGKDITDSRYIVLPSGYLRISNSQLEDSNTYKCIPSNRLGTALSATVMLSVTPKKPKPPVVSTLLTDVTVNQSSPLTLSCHVEYFNKSVQFTWLQDGKTIPGATLLNDTRIMHVPSTTKNHTGIFTCAVATEYGTDSAQMKVTVQYSPENPLLPDERRVIQLKPGENPELRCLSSAMPPPTIVWEKNGTIIDGADSLNDQASVLRLKNINESVAGEYTCRAKNLLGISETKFLVRVTSDQNTENTPNYAGPTTGIIEDDVDMYILIGGVAGGILVLVILFVFVILLAKSCQKDKERKLKKMKKRQIREPPKRQTYNVEEAESRKPEALHETYKKTFPALDVDDRDDGVPTKMLPRTYSISSQTSGFQSQMNLEQALERKAEPELATFKYDMTWPRRHSRMMRSQSQTLPAPSIDDLAAQIYDYNY